MILVSAIALVIVAIAGLVFLGAGGIDRTKSFAQSVTGSFKNSGIAKGSQQTVESIESAEIVTGGIASKRTNASKTTLRTTLIVPQSKKEFITLANRRDTAQFSTGQIGSLSQKEIDEITNRTLTDVQKRDIEALDARRARAIERGINPNLKRTGAELVRDKAIQEQLAKNLLTSRFGGQAFFKGKLFANPKFGAPSNDPRNLSAAEREEIRQNLIKNERIRKERQIVGTNIQSQLDTKGITQKQAALEKGANLIGGNKLNPIALAKLRERGLI